MNKHKNLHTSLILSALLLGACQNSSSEISDTTDMTTQQEEMSTDENAETTGEQSVQEPVSSADSTEEDQTTSDASQETAKPTETNLSFSLPGGCYEEPVELVLTGSGNGEIYYTLDGSDPATSDTRILYTEPILLEDVSGRENVASAVDPQLFDTAHCYFDEETSSLVTTAVVPDTDAVDKCNVVKAVYIDEDGQAYLTSCQTYFIGEMADHIQGLQESCEAAGTTLAVISITMDYDDLFDSETGIYVTGDIFEQSFADYLASGGDQTDDCGRKLAANYSQRGRDWEKNAYMEFYEVDTENTTCVLSQNCGIRIQGNYSRSDLQKSFRLYARSDYGDKRFRYSVFGDDLVDDEGNVIDSFKTLILRNGGNCAFNAKFNDTYWQSLVDEMDVDTQTSRPAVVYLNGEYWGLYVLQEDYTDEYFEDHHGVDSDQVVLYKGDAETYALGYKLDLGELPEGEEDESYYFSDLLDFLNSHDNLESTEDYEAFCEIVDPDSVRDYFAVQVWINNKWDWPGKNWSMWKTTEVDPDNPYADGRWRFCFFDVEFGGVCGLSEASTNTIKEDNYKRYGLLNKKTSNPAVLCFSYMMTNADFRQSFYEALNNLSDTIFAYDTADAVLQTFENTYGPLFDQFFARYPATGSTEEALYGGYASASCIRDFLKVRADYIQTMIDYAEQVENK